MTLTILGLYQYDNTLFDGVGGFGLNMLPTGMEKQRLIDLICVECAELEVLYPSVPAMKAAIELWVTRRAPIWAKLYNTMNLTYDPTENFRRTESSTDTREGDVSFSGSDEASKYNPGYNSGDQIVTERTLSTPGVATHSGDTVTHSATYHGNIGVIPTQELIERERKVVDFDLYLYICKDFKRNFCIMIY
jgi:hypothetical protein